ncbi:hypothetical protein [Allorhodopirellula heiligendammensis]|uniref:Uncharacterized protein n=1 Tax=Allorhodopirellula heiligendammensis TaxID=2714739 RepID=A0A5C6C0E6_9BACT|nr:hypothetical protein [Allorhodopirellula heiligendammensis]TWU18023.1 hypothetical protein Poly21_01760 [Allorhodopirellula heiligendammensis]
MVTQDYPLADSHPTPPLCVWGLIVQSDACSVARLFVARSFLIASRDATALAAAAGIDTFDVTAVRVECFGVASDPKTELAKENWKAACDAASVRLIPQESP